MFSDVTMCYISCLRTTLFCIHVAILLLLGVWGSRSIYPPPSWHWLRWNCRQPQGCLGTTESCHGGCERVATEGCVITVYTPSVCPACVWTWTAEGDVNLFWSPNHTSLAEMLLVYIRTRIGLSHKCAMTPSRFVTLCHAFPLSSLSVFTWVPRTLLFL